MTLGADEVASAETDERKNMIESQLPLGYAPEGETDEERGISRARDISHIINSFIKEYINLKIKSDSGLGSGSFLEPQTMYSVLSKEMDHWRDTKGKESIFSSDTKQNPYKLAGAFRLANANRVTRSLSTKMGGLWEHLAQLSPYAINPEIEFGGLKIQGVDLVVLNYNTGKLEHIQLKTKRDTLTGSQAPRSKTELGIHENPVFCAAFDLGPWNFNSPEIPRAAGAEFWLRIGIDYDLFERLTIKMIKELEDIFAQYDPTSVSER